MPTPLMKIGDSNRPESLQKNLYKVNSPYDLTDDVVTKSLNLLQSITGYDYRSNTVIDIVERLIDAKNSDLVRIGGERLLVEFGRRAAINTLGKFIPTPTNLVQDLKNIIKGDFKKGDDSITDLSKDPSRSLLDTVLQTGIGYRSNDNFLDKEYGKVKNTEFSDVNYKYSGDMIKEKIQQLNKSSVFSSYNVKETNKIDFNDQSLIFKNTYSEDFISNPISSIYNGGNVNTITDTYTKTYFKPYEKDDTLLAKNVILEAEDLEFSQGFGFLNRTIARELNNDPIGIQRVNSVDINNNAELNRQAIAENADTFRYDSNTSGQNLLNTQFGVRRGLVYFTSKLSKESNSIINHNVKQLYKYNESDDKAIYWKGNGACRTFTVYDQYDNYNRLIKFDGNNEKNSVLKESVLPRIAPMIGDRDDEKHRYFFTMENLAVKVTKNDDCDKGPNGGRWMWFVPYNVKISDNNSVNWSDLNFLGRPEPVFSYQNTTRSLSLSFSLLIDTVKEFQDLKPTIQNYYNYIYACNEVEYNPDNGGNTQITPNNNLKPKKKIKPDPTTFGSTIKYFFKNDSYGVKYQNIDYTSGDNCFEKNEDGDTDALYVPTLSTLTFNNNFLSTFTAATQFLVDNIPTCDSIVIEIKGLASKLFTKKTITNSAQYNSDLGYRRAYDMFKTLVEYFNANNGSLEDITYNDLGYLENLSANKAINQKAKINNCNILFVLNSKGERVASGGSTFANRNDRDEITDRRVEITSIKAYPKSSKNTNVNSANPTVEEKEKNSRNDNKNKTPQPCDPDLTLKFERLNIEDKFPVGYEKLKTFTPSFNSQTPFDFTKRYVFLHQLTRPGKLSKSVDNKVDNIVFGRMPVFILRYGDFLHTKAIVRSVNFDITESTWDLNPEGMGAIPLYCNVTMDLTLLGGQSLAGPIDRIQTANDSSFIANTSFNSGYYTSNNRFKSSIDQEVLQYGDKASGQDKTEKPIVGDINTQVGIDPPVEVVPLSLRGTPQPSVSPKLPVGTRNQIIEEQVVGPTAADRQKYIDKDELAKFQRKAAEENAQEIINNSEINNMGL
jgi:hypothetical protein